MKGISPLIAGVIFIAFSIVATILVYGIGMPLVTKMRESALVDRMFTTFSELDDVIRQVAAEGKGSRRTVTLTLDKGTFKTNGTEEVISWEIDTTADVISPRNIFQTGNVVLGSNIETKAYNGTLNGLPVYILENSHLIVYINRTGSASSMVYLNTSSLLIAIYQKDIGKWFNSTSPNKLMEITVDDESNSMSGSGYTTLVKESTSPLLGYGEVIAYINSDYSLNYQIHFVLDSGADFLTIKVDV